MQHNSLFEIKMSRRFHARLLPAIITNAPQAKFLGYFPSKNMEKWSKFRRLSRLFNFVASFPYPLDYHRCAAGDFFLNFRDIFFQKIVENYSFTVIMMVTKIFVMTVIILFTVKVTVMKTFSSFPIKKTRLLFHRSRLRVIVCPCTVPVIE